MRILVAEDEIELAEAMKMFTTGRTRCFMPNQHRMI